MTPQELDAIRARDAASIPRMLREPHILIPQGGDAFLRAEMDRRALLQEIDRLRAQELTVSVERTVEISFPEQPMLRLDYDQPHGLSLQQFIARQQEARKAEDYTFGLLRDGLSEEEMDA